MKWLKRLFRWWVREPWAGKQSPEMLQHQEASEGPR